MVRLSREDALRLGISEEDLPPSHERKYHNTPTDVDGITFASAKEAARYRELQLAVRAGVISNLRTQVSYPLIVRGQHVAVYIADFVYFDTGAGREIVEDVKSAATRRNRLYILKKKLLQALYDIIILET